MIINKYYIDYKKINRSLLHNSITKKEAMPIPSNENLNFN